MSIDIEDIKEKVLLVNISDTHYLNNENEMGAIEELSPEKKIQGAAQCFWLLYKNKVENCKYVFAVAKGKVYGVFKLDEQKKWREAECVEGLKEELKQKGQYVNYPPYRDIEIEAHTHKVIEEIEAMENDPNINKELLEKVIERIPIKDGKISARWFKRKFLCLNPCNENDLVKRKYEKKYLNQGGKKFRFYGAAEYFPKEK